MALAMLAEQQEAGLEEAKGDSELTPVELQIPRPVWAPGGADTCTEPRVPTWAGEGDRGLRCGGGGEVPLPLPNSAPQLSRAEGLILPAAW